jgi:hypothetical protein
MGMRKQVAVHKLAREASEERPPVIALDECAGVFDKLAILDCGRACSFASAAVKAFVDVIYKGIRDRGGSLRGHGALAMRAISRFALGLAGEVAQRCVDHLMDAAARGIGFQVPKAIRRAGVETQTAVNATGIVLENGILAWDGLRGGHGLAVSDVSPKGSLGRVCKQRSGDNKAGIPSSLACDNKLVTISQEENKGGAQALRDWRSVLVTGPQGWEKPCRRDPPGIAVKQGGFGQWTMASAKPIWSREAN